MMTNALRWFKGLLQRTLRGSSLPPPPRIGKREINRALSYEDRVGDEERERDRAVLERVQERREGERNDTGPSPEGDGP